MFLVLQAQPLSPILPSTIARGQVVTLTEGMLSWLDCLNRLDASLWDMLGRVREGRGGTAESAAVQALAGRLLDIESLGAHSGPVVWDLMLMRDSRFIASLCSSLGEASWWAHLLAGELPPSSFSTPTPTQAARHLEAMISVISNVITVEWLVSYFN